MTGADRVPVRGKRGRIVRRFRRFPQIGKRGKPQARAFPSSPAFICGNLRNLRTILWLALLWSSGGSGLGAPGGALRLPKGQDCFFVEDNFAYSRYLSLSHDGTYRQINQDADATVEADRGTWEQDARSVVLLHSTHRGLRFRALLSGPLTVVLDSPGKIDALPGVAEAIHRLLAGSEDAVFAAADAGELGGLPAVVSVDRGAEIFSRAEVSGLCAQIEQTVQTERTRTYQLTPVRVGGRPLVLVLQGAVFGPERVTEICREYRVPPGAAPPFYFARVDAREFARRAGVWRGLEEESFKKPSFKEGSSVRGSRKRSKHGGLAGDVRCGFPGRFDPADQAPGSAGAVTLFPCTGGVTPS